MSPGHRAESGSTSLADWPCCAGGHSQAHPQTSGSLATHVPSTANRKQHRGLEAAGMARGSSHLKPQCLPQASLCLLCPPHTPMPHRSRVSC